MRPPLRQLFSRHRDSEDKLVPESEKSPRWPKSPRSPKSPGSPRSPKPLTWTEINKDYLNQCLGCKNVDIFIRQNIEKQKNSEKRLSSTILHYSFDELDTCTHRCEICRVFRQSLFLEEATFEGAEKLRKSQGAVIVHWQETSATDGALRISLAVEIEGVPVHAGVVNCDSQGGLPHLALRPDGRDLAVIGQAKEWLETCRKSHVGQCDNLKFSSENPKLLIRILSDRSIQLCERQKVEYVALSYCWGNPEKGSPDWEETKRGETTSANLKERHQPFPMTELPATVRDALYIIYAIGIRYAWIDTLCINQDTKEGMEMMHKIYSNALFTLCSCATTKATANLLNQREAWTQRTEPCRLGGQWLTTYDMSLNELRLRSPLAGRAWTLQEERLSPRMLYISSSRMYWSCAGGSEMEMKPTYEQKALKLHRPMYAASDRNLDMPEGQEFLMACKDGTDKPGGLHKFWADIVKSYALRSMSDLRDRLTALSGLAAKYLSADTTDEYLVGLWANNLAEGLAWKVQGAIDHRKINRTASEWPSWSWAKLPVQSAIETIVESAKSPFFGRIIDEDARNLRTLIDPEKAVKQGALVKNIGVKGRVRSLWKTSSHPTDWSNVSRNVDGEEKFTFASSPEQDMHAIHLESGRILVYENRKREIVGQLDFQQDIERVQLGQIHLWALEVGGTTMLLLEPCGENMYRRVGAAWDVRKDFFAMAKSQVLILR